MPMILQDKLVYANYVWPPIKEYSIDVKVKDWLDDYSVLRRRLHKTARRCVDIGAHIGIYAYEYSKRFDIVDSFEPIPSIYKLLDQNTNTISNINCYNYAVSNNNKDVLIYENPRNSESNVVVSTQTEALIQSRWGTGKRWEGQTPITVPAITIDSFGWDNVDLIKVDTEGYIKEVLEGMVDTLTNNSPIVQLEVRDTGIPATKADINPLLSSLGYKVYSSWKQDDFYVKVDK